MTIKQHGGIFGRNPSFNDVSVETLSIAGTALSSTAAELNILDGVTADATEINYLDGASISAVVASKAVLANSSGNIAFPNSKGIDFSATAGTGTSELFDDYEEGAWTPQFTAQTGTFTTMTYSNNTGTYTKIGRIVVVHFNIFTSNVDLTGASGALRISGLPYAAAGEGGFGSVYSMYRWAFASDRVSPVGIGAITGETYLAMRKDTVNAASATGVDVTDLQTGAGGFRNAIQGTVVYEV